MDRTIETALHEQLGNKLHVHKNISPYITIRTPCSAEYYYEAESREEWQKVIRAIHKMGIPLLVIGGGSNIAVTHDTISGMVIRNMYRHRSILSEKPREVDMLISSGYIVNALVKETAQEGYSGFEYHLGLPGTVGGALYMNSKWTISNPVSYFGDSLMYADIMDRKGEIRREERSYFRFAYDYSYLQETGELVIDAVFKLTKEDPEKLMRRAHESLEYRKKTQPIGVATSGCFFKNISIEDRDRLHLTTTSAGYLIDSAGLKNSAVGNFIVSDKHANFIINKGGGTAADLVTLVSLVKRKVEEKYGVKLEEEVRVI